MATFLTVAQVAENLQIHEDTIRRAIALGDLAVSRVGRAIRIKPENVDRWIGA
ncbi:hypothetical protein GCM10007304_14690 [Rhodococcoides trifolii]|uniref:Helix-turn-helix domain-containing protein n=1 Tax=Rhodococcoides trifolii TaxID=908250 RepID=A0A917FU68_9NOCA|nr:helix-turn-helix domain-containing protein [Rhodococcus trifolii]GGG01746.1 hypothetical protein GCM10007304_14690 [Rhodococcus trifolii]